MSAHARSKSTNLRVSLYRHVYGEAAKETNRYDEIKNALYFGDGSYCKANAKFFAIPKKGGGGPLYIIRHEDVGRLPTNVPLLSVHKGSCWDFDFNPFMDNMIATASDDSKVAITTFPMEGLKESILEATVVLEGHNKKSTNCVFHPTANGILATGGFDRAVKIWNIESAANVFTYDQFEDTLFSLEWNHDGSLLGSSSKDKKIRMFDPRQLDKAQSTVAFDGTQTSKIFWVPKFGWIGATGFSKSAKRQVKLFDLRKSTEPILSNDIDQSAGVLLPHWDNDNGILFLAAKGEGNINYYELENDEKMMHNLSAYRSTVPQKGGGWLPKKCMDVWKCEIDRFLKLTESSVIPVSFIVPRKAGTEVFQKDIFPDAYAGEPALSASDWLAGQNKDPILTSMDPKNNGKDGKRNSAPSAIKLNKALGQADLAHENERLKKENDDLRERVRDLEKQLGITTTEASRDDSREERDTPYTDEAAEVSHEQPSQEQPTNEYPNETDEKE
jgi:coronin-1B/1C/6